MNFTHLYLQSIYNNLIISFCYVKEKKRKKILFISFWSYSSHQVNSFYFMATLLIFIKFSKLSKNQSGINNVEDTFSSLSISPVALLSPLSFLSFTFLIPRQTCPTTGGWNQNHIERPKRRVPSPVASVRCVPWATSRAPQSLVYSCDVIG